MNWKIFDLSALRDRVSVDLDMDRTEFLKRFQHLIAPDEGYFTDELLSHKKIYLGKLDSNKFVLRKRRKLFRLGHSPAAATGEISELNGKTRLDIKIMAFDRVNKVVLALLPIFFILLFAIEIINQAYQVLIVLIPLSFLFLIFLRFLGRKRMNSFKTELLTHINSL